MMFFKYHRNAIITGYMDSYCLVCESHLRSKKDINGHIAKPIHFKNLDANSYLEKHKDDCVRKVKKGYFCEFCNVLLSTAAKVGLHVIEEKHISNKGIQLLRRIGNNIAFQDILINEKAWNGLIDDTCAICNTEFDNELLHKTETAHILNLVQNKVEFGADKSIYRMIDDSSFQCLTCNIVLGSSMIKTHFEQSDHKKLYEKCIQAAMDVNPNIKLETPLEQIPKTTTQVTEKATPINIEVKKATLDSSPKQLEVKQDKPKKEVPIASIMKQDAPTKKTIIPTEVTKKNETLTKPKKSEGIKLEAATADLDEQICKALNAKDYITYDENGKKWCLLCDWTMDSVVIFNHVNGRHHQTMLKLHRERLQNKKKSKELTETNKTNTEKVQKEEMTPEQKQEQEKKSKILDAVLHFQQNNVNINFENNKAMCKKCSTILDFNCKAIEAHIEQHKKGAFMRPPKKEAVKLINQKVEGGKKTADSKNTQKSDDKKTQQLPKRTEEERADSRASSVASNKETEEEVEKFAKANDLAYNRRDNKVYCRVCDTRIPASTRNMKEHIEGQHHKNRVAKYNITKLPPTTIKTPMIEFIKNIAVVTNGLNYNVIINERYCIHIFSFLMITYVDQPRCEPCGVNLSDAQVDDHKESISHMKAMCETKIVASMESEFIREVRPDIFHCGYCNTVSAGEDLQAHLGTTSHREAKASGGWRLYQALAEMQHQNSRQQFDMRGLFKKMQEDLFW